MGSHSREREAGKAGTGAFRPGKAGWTGPAGSAGGEGGGGGRGGEGGRGGGGRGGEVSAFAQEESRNSRNLVTQEDVFLLGGKNSRKGIGRSELLGEGNQLLKASVVAGKTRKGERREWRKEWKKKKEEGEEEGKKCKRKRKKRNSSGIQLFSCSRKFPRSWKFREREGGRNARNLRLGAKEGPIKDDPINQ